MIILITPRHLQCCRLHHSLFCNFKCTQAPSDSSNERHTELLTMLTWFCWISKFSNVENVLNIRERWPRKCWPRNAAVWQQLGSSSEVLVKYFKLRFGFHAHHSLGSLCSHYVSALCLPILSFILSICSYSLNMPSPFFNELTSRGEVHTSYEPENYIIEKFNLKVRKL